jgi:tetratricopeptide (TPR) repeat protein
MLVQHFVPGQFTLLGLIDLSAPSFYNRIGAAAGASMLLRTLPGRSSSMALGWYTLAFLFILPPISAKAQQQHLQDSARMLQQGDLAGAESEARLATADASSRALAYAILGAIRLQQAKYAESAGFLETAVRLNPRLLGAQLNLGNVYMLQGRREAARARFHQALELDPGNFNARFALARIANEAGDHAASIELARPILKKLRQSEDGLMLIASNSLANGDPSQASSLLPSWFALDHPSLTGSLGFAQVFASHQLFEQAISILDHAQSQDAGSFDLYFSIATYYFRLNDLPNAGTNYKLALDARPECSRCLYQLSRVAEQQNNSDEALSYLVAARKIAPRDADILFEFGKVCMRKDLYEDAIQSLSTAVQLRPDNVSFQYVLASAYTSRKNYKLAIPILEHLLTMKPNDSVLHYSLGAIQYLDNDLKGAEGHLQRSIQADPTQVASYYYLGLVKQHEGKTEEATQIFKTLADRYPDHAPTFLALGEILLGEHKYSEARSALERATQLEPSSVKSHYQLGMVLARLGQSEASQKEFALVKDLNTRADKQTEMQIMSPQD